MRSFNNKDDFRLAYPALYRELSKFTSTYQIFNSAEFYSAYYTDVVCYVHYIYKNKPNGLIVECKHCDGQYFFELFYPKKQSSNQS